MDDGDLATVPIHNGGGSADGRIDNGGLAVLWFGWFLGFLRSKVWVDFQRTVPFRVGKQVGHIAEVHDREVGLTLLLPQPGTPADDLLELRHGADHLVQHDQLDHFAVGSGGEQL